MAIGKQQILDEIVRAATGNGGTALGRLKFEHETGITENDWKRHWIRWSDAVKEAGLQPNEWTQAYDDTVLLQRLCEFIRELGHFPVSGEFRMKSRASDFPSESVFRRLGIKGQMATRIIEYCQSIDDFDDVANICAPIATNDATEEPSGRDKENSQPDGYVYLLKLGRQYKIGRAKDFYSRERQLAIQMPERAETVHTIRTDDPVGIEKYWHTRFAEVRLNGEWFQLKAADIKAFKRRKFM